MLLSKINRIFTILIACGIMVFAAFFYLLISSPDSFWQYTTRNKLLPRFIAWFCLILGVYGVARRRFSMMITIFLFMVAFFFAYLGKFIFKNMY